MILKTNQYLLFKCLQNLVYRKRSVSSKLNLELKVKDSKISYWGKGACSKTKEAEKFKN